MAMLPVRMTDSCAQPKRKSHPASKRARQIVIVAAGARIGGGQFRIAQRADQRQHAPHHPDAQRLPKGPGTLLNTHCGILKMDVPTTMPTMMLTASHMPSFGVLPEARIGGRRCVWMRFVVHGLPMDLSESSYRIVVGRIANPSVHPIGKLLF